MYPVFIGKSENVMTLFCSGLILRKRLYGPLTMKLFLVFINRLNSYDLTS